MVDDPIQQEMLQKPLDNCHTMGYNDSMMKNKFLFYIEYHDGSVVIVDNLSKAKAKRLYNEALADWTDLELRGCGYEEVQSPLTLQQQIKYKKADRTFA